MKVSIIKERVPCSEEALVNPTSPPPEGDAGREAALRMLIRQEQQSRWEAFGFSEEWSFDLASVAPEGGSASKYRVTFFSKEGRPQRMIFLKQYRHPQIDAGVVENEFGGMQVAEQAFRATERFRVPRPFSYRKDEKVLFMEHCPSISLKAALFRPLLASRFFISNRDREKLKRYVVETGRLLSCFQRIPAHLLQGEGEATEEVVLRYQRQLLRSLQICRKAGFPEASVQRIQSVVLNRLERQSSFPPIILQHSDFAPWNVMVGDRYLYLSDFQQVTAGFAAYDAAFFYSALELLFRYRTIDRVLLSQMQSAFLESYLDGGGETGFDRGGEMERERRLPLFEAFRLMHMVHFAQAILSPPAGGFYQSLCAVPFRRFLIDWFHQRLEG